LSAKKQAETGRDHWIFSSEKKHSQTNQKTYEESQKKNQPKKKG